MTEKLYSKRHLMMGLVAVPFSFFMPIAQSRDDKFAFTPQSTIGDVLDEPLFAPFASYLLPLELLSPTRRLGSKERAIKLSNLSHLLPYNTHIDVQEACSILNRLKQRSKSRQKIWIPLSHSDAGLLFYPCDKNAPFVLIAAGGGFAYVGSIHEGFPYAEAMNRHGFNAFVLQYRISGWGQSAMSDMAEGLHYILTHADDLGVNPSVYALMGSSAGARMAALMGKTGLSAWGYPRFPKATAVLMAYTGYDEVSRDDPPTFMVQGTADRIAPITVVDRRMRSLEAMGIETKYMRFPGLPHGFGLGSQTTAQGWIDHAADFFRLQIKNSKQ